MGEKPSGKREEQLHRPEVGTCLAGLRRTEWPAVLWVEGVLEWKSYREQVDRQEVVVRKWGVVQLLIRAVWGWICEVGPRTKSAN